MVTRREIKNIVGKLLKGNSIVNPPVPVEKIAKTLGLEVRYEPFIEKTEDVSGMLYRDQNTGIVGVNSLHQSNRQRFTLAHEIGHYLLHKTNKVFVDQTFGLHLRDSTSSQAIDRQEIEANHFAAELLMPEAMIVHALKDQSPDDIEKLPEKLASRFDVSVQAMAFRLANLRLVKTI